MKYLKRIICLLIASAVAFVCASCSGAEPAQPVTQAVTDAPTEAATPDEDDRLALVDFIKTFDKDAQLVDEWTHDEDGVRLSVDGIEYDPINGPAILFSAENAKDKEITIRTDSVAVNGYMMTSAMSMSVPASGKDSTEMFIPYTALALADIDRIAELELSFRITEADNNDKYDSIAPIVLRTSAADGYEPEYVESGQLAYDSWDVRIILKGIDSSRAYSEGEALIVYMVNDSDKAVTVQADKLTVNGYEFTSAMNTFILPGKRAVDTLTIYDMDMEEYGVEQIDSVELSFKLIDESEWKALASTGTISVELESENG